MDIDPQSSQSSQSSSSSKKNSPQSSAFVSSESLTSFSPRTAAFSFPNQENLSSRLTSISGNPGSHSGLSRSNHRVRDSPIQKRKYSSSSNIASTGKQRSTSELMEHKKKQQQSWQQSGKQTKSHSFSSTSSLSDQMANLRLRDISKQRSSLPADPKAAAASSASSSSFKLGDVIDRIFSEAFNDTR